MLSQRLALREKKWGYLNDFTAYQRSCSSMPALTRTPYPVPCCKTSSLADSKRRQGLGLGMCGGMSASPPTGNVRGGSSTSRLV